MNCPKCKNPIADNVTECEWCGMSFAIIENEKQVEKVKINILDADLISLLAQGQKSKAIELYKKRTGANNYDCRYHVARLSFFLQHEHATESTWLNYVEKSKRKWLWSRWMSWILLPIALYLSIGSVANMDKEMGFVFLLIPMIVVVFLLIYWMCKTKKI